MAQKSAVIFWSYFDLQKYNRRKTQIAQERNVADSRLMEMLLQSKVGVSYGGTNEVEIWKWLESRNEFWEGGP
jgi:hypothetical protein